jgi:hypothetical protein
MGILLKAILGWDDVKQGFASGIKPGVGMKRRG